MLNAEQERILARVKKLLALSEDNAATEGERDNAIRMAHATLAKYNLSIAQVQESAIERIRETCEYVGQWTRPVTNGIARLFFCVAYRESEQSKGKKCVISFVGQTANVVTARGMAEYVMRSIVREVGKLETEAILDGKRLDKDWKESFCYGAGVKVKERCFKMRKEAESQDTADNGTGTALVLASHYKREQEANIVFLSQKFGVNLTTTAGPKVDTAGFNAGQTYGASISLHRQMGHAPTGTRRLK